MRRGAVRRGPLLRVLAHLIRERAAMRLLNLVLPVLTASLASGAATTAGPLALGPSAFAVPGVFPKSVYPAYFNDPTATSAQPQPVISDPVLVRLDIKFLASDREKLTPIYSTRSTQKHSLTRSISLK